MTPEDVIPKEIITQGETQNQLKDNYSGCLIIVTFISFGIVESTTFHCMPLYPTVALALVSPRFIRSIRELNAFSTSSVTLSFLSSLC